MIMIAIIKSEKPIEEFLKTSMRQTRSLEKNAVGKLMNFTVKFLR
jgi:hypothetical protein